MDRLFYRVPEAAALCGVKPRTVWKLIARGELHASHIGRCTVISRAELERYAHKLDKQSAQKEIVT